MTVNPLVPEAPPWPPPPPTGPIKHSIRHAARTRVIKAEITHLELGLTSESSEMLTPEPFGSCDHGFTKWEVWQGDGLDWWPKNNEADYDDDETVQVVYKDGAINREDECKDGDGTDSATTSEYARILRKIQAEIEESKA